ncbi:hypothetical protein M501DRAFT_1001230 [Patellaria atrata CBS 101060]|uniref:Uncharacterized protein n=1 Tax=Patellaria atrata CBS 101060 TaxID=1346257 RepID=A0A9P4VIR8_9PEZI|nr:hypothetical protein M501DRAFT_1001230 [Patellaria atrata CBS 101060]
MPFTKSYRIVPQELFRLNNRHYARLRPWDSCRKPRMYDIHLTESGIALREA